MPPPVVAEPAGAEGAAPVLPPGGELPIEGKTVKALTLLSLKRTYDLFVGNHGQKPGLDEDSQKLKIACKMRDEYAAVNAYRPRDAPTGASANRGGPAGTSGKAGAAAAAAAGGESKSTLARMIDSLPEPADKVAERNKGKQLVVHSGGGGPAPPGGITPAAKAALAGTVMVPTAGGGQKEYTPSATLARRLPSKWPRPAWHPPWKIYRVIAGHLGWVRSVAFDPANEWFCTGSADRTIKIWDTASGQLKLTLTGHIEQVTGLGVSDRHPYMFSCGLDKMVKCWDLEQNKVIRNYHGHLSGVYCMALHPTLDILMTGGRDSVCRVWDMRTKVQIHCLSGHTDNVAAVLAQPADPQVITASHDKTIRLWDLRTGKTLSTLTYHKKAIRALAAHPQDWAFASGAADNIKKFKLPQGNFLHNFLQQPKAIVNCMAINEDGVVCTGADNGAMWAWDWRSGNAFQQSETVAQPGSLDAEQGIYAMSFDMTGSRLVTCEADKTVKMWREDETATPETHPINFRPPKDIRRF